jgi:hypothetical protein
MTHSLAGWKDVLHSYPLLVFLGCTSRSLLFRWKLRLSVRGRCRARLSFESSHVPTTSAVVDERGLP